jgi:predicted O-methyltransferase YrrM
VIAELGAFTGAFSSAILRICEPAELHLIDTWEGRVECGDKDGENMQVIDDMAVVYLALALRGDKRYTLHRDTTQNALKRFPDHYFDFIYVDADHSEKAVYDDLVLSMRKSLWGIGGHDYCPRFDGVMRAVDMFCSDWNWKMTHITQDKCPSYLLRPA